MRAGERSTPLTTREDWGEGAAGGRPVWWDRERGDEPVSVGRVLVAGDRHILSSLMVQALREELGEDLEVTTIDFDWPMEPHVNVAEVKEAAGSEEEVIAAGESAEVIVTQLAPITQKVLGSLEDLRLVIVTRGGPVNVNVDAATEHG